MASARTAVASFNRVGRKSLFQFASDAELPIQLLLTFPVDVPVGFSQVEMRDSLVAHGTGCLEKRNFSDHGISLCIRVSHQVVLRAYQHAGA